MNWQLHESEGREVRSHAVISYATKLNEINRQDLQGVLQRVSLMNWSLRGAASPRSKFKSSLLLGIASIECARGRNKLACEQLHVMLPYRLVRLGSHASARTQGLRLRRCPWPRCLLPSCWPTRA